MANVLRDSNDDVRVKTANSIVVLACGLYSRVLSGSAASGSAGGGASGIPLYTTSVECNELSLCIIFAARGTAALSTVCPTNNRVAK